MSDSSKGMMMGIHPMMIAGALFSISWFVLIDSWIMANREVDPSNHVSFVTVLPAMITTIGFMIINMTSPSDVTGGSEGFGMGGGSSEGVECSKPFIFMFIGWFICMASTIFSLTFVGMNYLGETTRTMAFPGVAMVMHSCMLPCVAAMMWFSKGGGQMGEEDDW